MQTTATTYFYFFFHLMILKYDEHYREINIQITMYIQNPSTSNNSF